MKKIALRICALLLPIMLTAQNDASTTAAMKEEKILNALSETACKCIDSVETFDRSKNEISKDIHRCIDKQVMAYQMVKKLTKVDNLKLTEGEGEKVKIEINTNPESDAYKMHYYEIESHLMENCPAIKNKIAVDDKVGAKSLSENAEAMKYYNQGFEDYQKGNYEKAIQLYKKAIVFDKDFAFAYDNMGICYRQLEQFDKAIEAYEHSLEINPKGLMPLQNMAIAYLYKKDFKKAVKSYEKLAQIDDKNPEVYYGLGNVYVVHLKEYEKGLEHLCQAYNIYVDQKSPYRSDAEKLIQYVYQEMKKQGKEEQFAAILQKNNIRSN